VRRSQGYTLVELLTVIAIAAILASISVGVFVKMGHKNELEATTNLVRAIFRRARNAAREERAPALVEIDAREGEVRAQTRETITLFRFEQDQLDGAPDSPAGSDPKAPMSNQRAAASAVEEFTVRGSHGIEGHVVGADSIEGRLGLALDFERPGSFVSIPDRPVLSPVEGVAVEAWIYPAKLEEKIPDEPMAPSEKSRLTQEAIKLAGTPPRPTPPRAWKYWNRHQDDPPLFTVIRKGRAFELAVRADYAVECAVSGRANNDATTAGEMTYIAHTGPGVVRPGKWARVELVFDGRELACAIDGIRRVLTPLHGFETMPKLLARDSAQLVFSDPDPERSFAGSIDEVKVQGVLRSERVTVPKNVAILAPTGQVFFDALGQLDPLHHSEPVVLWLSDDDKALAALEPPAEPLKTRERPRSAVDLAAAKAATDQEKAARFAALARSLGERARLVSVELTGAVR
jgi:prepilin-type N-terminal cleavage/methylation domain-containing protein